MKLLGTESQISRQRIVWGRGERLLQIIIRLNTLVDIIRVPKVRTSGE